MLPQLAHNWSTSCSSCGSKNGSKTFSKVFPTVALKRRDIRANLDKTIWYICMKPKPASQGTMAAQPQRSHPQPPASQPDSQATAKAQSSPSQPIQLAASGLSSGTVASAVQILAVRQAESNKIIQNQTNQTNQTKQSNQTNQT